MNIKTKYNKESRNWHITINNKLYRVGYVCKKKAVNIAKRKYKRDKRNN